MYRRRKVSMRTSAICLLIEERETMKKILAVLVLVTLIVAVFVVSTALADGHQRNFRAHLSGSEEVPPVNTRAQGQAIFQLSKDGTELHYRLIVANIQNVTQAHIHLAPAGVNGPVVAWLYPGAPPAQLIPGRFNGVLSTGVITGADLVGPLAGQTLEDLLDAMRDGDTYVNVHTSQFPPGEVRGQIR
jgi:hypothetical protein